MRPGRKVHEALCDPLAACLPFSPSSPSDPDPAFSNKRSNLTLTGTRDPHPKAQSAVAHKQQAEEKCRHQSCAKWPVTNSRQQTEALEILVSYTLGGQTNTKKTLET